MNKHEEHQFVLGAMLFDLLVVLLCCARKDAFPDFATSFAMFLYAVKLFHDLNNIPWPILKLLYDVRVCCGVFSNES